jgi:sterol desaturase/sphingolipid hydroxylase (fatty acid hydroxylase superfamily)
MTDHLARHAAAFGVDVLRLSVRLVLLVCVFVPLERLFALHPAKIWRKQVGVDLAWYVINSLVPAAVIAVPLAVLARALNGVNPFGLYSAIAAWPKWVRLLAMMLVSDFGSYWAHRAFHAFPVLWRFHAVHHSAEELDWLVNSRAHPLDLIVTRLSGLSLCYVLGLAQAQGGALDPLVAAVAFFGMLWTFFIHANIRCRLGPLEWLISTPAFHHWHHTNDEHRDRNFAAIFPVFDRIFGTSWLPKYWPPVYGIDEKLSPTLTGQLLDPLAPAPSSATTASAQNPNEAQASGLAKRI